MKRISTVIFSLLIGISAFNTNAQNKVGTIWHCNTDELTEESLHKSRVALSLTLPYDTQAKIINVFVHVVKRDDGTGGLSNTQVSNWITVLCNDFSARNIAIRVTGQANLNSTTFFDGINDSNYSSLISTNTHSDAIDIYMLSPTDTYARAGSTPGVALAVGGFFVGTSVISHEFGHCLGLYHTHSGRGCSDTANCSENVDGSNCSTCGDLVCDTPADPCLSGNVNTNCEYTGSNTFAPDVTNTMSYAPPTCLNHFTTGQANRMHYTIIHNSIFTNRSYRPSISGADLLCSSSSYSVNNVPTGSSVSWGVSPSGNVSFGSPSSSSTTITKVGNGQTSINVTVNTGCGSAVFSKNIWTGNPNLIKKFNGSIAGTVGVTAGSLNNLEASSNSPSTTFNYNDYNGTGNIAITIYSPTTASTNMYVSSLSTTGARYVRVTATNTCGSYYEDFVFYLMSFRIIAYPNPARDLLTLKFDNIDEKEFLPDFIELVNEKSLKTELYLSIDNVFKDALKRQGNEYIMDINKLERGTWFLRAIKKGHEPEVIKLIFE